MESFFFAFSFYSFPSDECFPFLSSASISARRLSYGKTHRMRFSFPFCVILAVGTMTFEHASPVMDEIGQVGIGYLKENLGNPM